MSNPWGDFLVLVVCVGMAVPLHAARAEGEVDRYISEAVRLYEDLEYELALERLERARQAPHGEDEAVSLALYRGILSAELGRWEAAREGFQAALLLRPDARLPLRVSPKVEREFEAQRAWAQAELARKRQDSPRLAESLPSPSVPEAHGQVEPAQLMPPTSEPRAEAAPHASAPVPSGAPESARDVVTGLVPPGTSDAAGKVVAGEPSAGVSPLRRVPVVSLVLLGTAVATGGTGTVFGLSSRGQLEDARGAHFRDEVVSRHAQAQRSAKTANLLFGTAGAAAAGALVTWLLMGSPEGAAPQGGAR
ncbi:hypothetical protein ACLESD_06225 [Pyxidicoccus sp. 3LFB2]